MKATVTYHSMSGNTERVARTIAGALPGDVTLSAIGEQPALDGSDVVFVGMPIVRFGPPEEVREYLKAQCAGRAVALFVTHAAPEGMTELEPWLEACREAAAGTRLVGFFDCQGALAASVRQSMIDSGMPQLVQFAKMASMADGQPDDARLAAARAFAANVAANVSHDAAASSA